MIEHLAGLRARAAAANRPQPSGQALGSPSLLGSGQDSDERSARDAERALIRSLVRREARAGERLRDTLIDAVDSTIARTLGRGQPEHDDLVQATFEQLVATLLNGTFRYDCSLRSWAISIASHLALNTIRSRRRERVMFEKWREVYCGDAAAASCGERAVDTRRTFARLRVELETMNQERAQALILFHVLECDQKQVATMLGISVAAAQSRIARGRRELQARMDRYSGGTHDG